MFDVNVKGTLIAVKKFLPLMPRASSIILNASIISIKGPAAFSVYAATKAAPRSFARSWIVDFRERQIRVNVISPGTVPTPGYDSFHSHGRAVGRLPRRRADDSAGPKKSLALFYSWRRMIPVS
jgi:NAD(P)-dependent dehydrogenase (short-subunit alcohol dehydrogenase family)